MVTDLTDLITQKLKAKQRELGLADKAFAEKIGISRPLWALIKSGKREPKLKIVKGVVRVFPEFTVDIMAWLREQDRGRN